MQMKVVHTTTIAFQKPTSGAWYTRRFAIVHDP